jgi:hypothetical protein
MGNLAISPVKREIMVTYLTGGLGSFKGTIHTKMFSIVPGTS